MSDQNIFSGPPNWCKTAIASKGGWTHPVTGEVLYQVGGNFLTRPEYLAYAIKPLATLPLPLGTRMVFHGDSQMQFNHLFSTLSSGASDLGVSSAAAGLITQAHSLDSRIDISTWFDANDPWYDAAVTNSRQWQGANQGIAGDHLVTADDHPTIHGGGIVKRLDYTLAKGGQLMFFEGGTNTIASGDNFVSSADYVIGKLDEALKKIRNAGKWCITTTIWPRSDFTTANGKEQIRLAVNTWIRAQAGREGIVGIVDPENLLNPGGVQDISFFTADPGNMFVHLNPKGTLAVARDYLNPIIAQAVSAGSTFNQDPLVNNLIPASIVQMPTEYNWAGGANVGGSTGSKIATGYTLRRTRGAGTYSSARELISTGYYKQAFTFTSSGSDTASNGFDFTLPVITAANITGGVMPAPGTWLRAHINFEVTAAAESVPLTFITMKFTDSTGPTDRAAARGLFGSFSAFGLVTMTGSTRTGWLSTPPFQIPAGMVYDQLTIQTSTYIDGRIATTVNPVVKYSKPILRVATDPRIAWGY
jgi:hypothetical protein